MKQSVDLSRQAADIQKVLTEITPLNAGKKREQAAELLKRWFPQMARFSGQLKKYKAVIVRLGKENAALQKQLEAARLWQKVAQLRRFVDSIPLELRRELQQVGRGKANER